MININDFDIANGETKRMNCPECGGYKTFTVTNNMGSHRMELLQGILSCQWWHTCTLICR